MLQQGPLDGTIWKSGRIILLQNIHQMIYLFYEKTHFPHSASHHPDKLGPSRLSRAGHLPRRRWQSLHTRISWSDWWLSVSGNYGPWTADHQSTFPNNHNLCRTRFEAFLSYLAIWIHWLGSSGSTWRLPQRRGLASLCVGIAQVDCHENHLCIRNTLRKNELPLHGYGRWADSALGGQIRPMGTCYHPY